MTHEAPTGTIRFKGAFIRYVTLLPEPSPVRTAEVNTLDKEEDIMFNFLSKLNLFARGKLFIRHKNIQGINPQNC